MPKRSNEFQKLVLLVKKHAAAGATVTESKLLRDNITGTDREVDVCIDSVVADHPVIVSIECRDRGRKANVQWIEEMKAKHERLPTHVLVLVSSTGFTKEAARVARSYGIETVALDEIDATAADRLFGETSSLWAKVFTLTPAKVVVRVAPTGALPAENVVVRPDHQVHSSARVHIGFVKHLVEFALRHDNVMRKFSGFGSQDHKFFEVQWSPGPDMDGNSLCLEKIEPRMLRPIERVYITGPCSFEISEFRLRHGRLGNIKVAWASGSFDGKDAILVASEDTTGKKMLSISTENIVVKRNTKEPHQSGSEWFHQSGSEWF